MRDAVPGFANCLQELKSDHAGWGRHGFPFFRLTAQARLRERVSGRVEMGGWAELRYRFRSSGRP